LSDLPFDGWGVRLTLTRALWPSHDFLWCTVPGRARPPLFVGFATFVAPPEDRSRRTRFFARRRLRTPFPSAIYEETTRYEAVGCRVPAFFEPFRHCR
jgi:hypothetical protein